jgi:poly(beta-D-mannuronate) lyase
MKINSVLTLRFCLLLLLITAASSEARKINVSTVSQLKTAIQNILPGDTIEVANGTYDFNGNISIIRSGTAEEPVVIKALNKHQAVLINTSYFTLKKAAYITIEGFLFNSRDVTAVKTESCNNIRVTRNIFRLQETTSRKWILIGGTWNESEPNSFNNRIDHNLFEEKHFPGNFITIDGSPDPTAKSSQYDRIDHNHFRNIGPRVENEMEAIRVGWSEMSMSSGFTTIEYNLFENCDGDPEVISVKTCDNIIRYNTFRTSQGTLCLRHGNRSVVEGNFFLGNMKAGTGGVRVYGDDHLIYNNYFEGLTGTIWDAPITITNGDADSNSTSLSKHFRPKRIHVLFNTIVNNLYNIEFGYTNNGSYSRAPKDIYISNNIVTGSANNLIKVYTNPINLVWNSNIFFPKDSAAFGIFPVPQGIKITDPLLVFTDSLWKLSSSSPAVDSSYGSYNFITYDVDGQNRDQYPDIGADEYSTAPIILRPLRPEDVGPEGDDFVVPVELSSAEIKVSSNDVILSWATASEKNNSGFEIERSNSTGFFPISFVKGNGTSLSPSSYSFVDKDLVTGKYLYRIKQIDYNGSYNYLASFEALVNAPEEFSLYQNYPNPFNPETQIEYSLPSDSFIDLKVYTPLGEELKTLYKGFKESGNHKIKFSAGNIPAGVYLYKLESSNKTLIRKMVLVK